MDEFADPLFHNNEPVKLDAVNTELPQLLTTATVGAAGIWLTVMKDGFEIVEHPSSLV